MNAPALPAVAILGRPNVGKSTLFNRLVGRRQAIVDDTPGVTRDRIEGVCRLGPSEFRVIDTAGLELRHHLNLDHVMWSTDYPHSGTDWPNSRITMDRQFRGLPLDEVRKLVHTNARELYRVPVPTP